MAIKTYVDGGKQAITFNNDTQPVAVYVDGDLQENVSFVPDTVQGTGSVEYTSEYKKNHIQYEVQGATSQVLLPTEYQQVEYIESTGTQYIDTGVVGNENTCVELDFYTNSDKLNVFGSRTSSTENSITIGVAYYVSVSEKCVFGDFYSYDAIRVYYDIVNLTSGRFTVYLSKNSRYIKHGGEVVAENTTPVTTAFTTPTNMLLGNIGGDPPSNSTIFKGRVYSCKIWNGDTLVRNFIPCYRKSDNVIGMYDLVSGTLYTNSGTGTFVKGANAPTPEAPIPIENANDNGISVVLRGENLFNAQGSVKRGNGLSNMRYGNNYIENVHVDPSAANCLIYSKIYKAGTYTISAKGEYEGTGFTYRFLCTVKYNGGTYNSYYNSYYFDLLKKTSPQNTFTFTTTEDFQIGFAWSGSPAYLRGIIYDIMLTPTSQAVEYKSYVEETVEIPTSITSTTDKPILNNGVALADGTSVPLLFSEYDKLTVDRVNNEVIYYNGGYSKTLNGNEATGSSTTLFKVWVTIPFKLTGDGFCNQFLSPTDFIFANNLSFGDSGMAFPMSRFSSTNALAAFLTEQYNNGTPVVIVAQKETPTPYNITNTDLGQLLLNLNTQNQTNYFEITSNANAPLTPINFTFAKWGGRDENNNNT